MRSKHNSDNTDPDPAVVSAFYDQFSDVRMLNYLQAPNLRIERAIQRILPYVEADSFVLDIGCGIGLVSERIAQMASEGQVRSIDISAKNISYARERVPAPNVEFRQIDVIRNFDDLAAWLPGPIDLAVMVDVLEHLPLPQHLPLFRNLAGVMADEASVVLTIPSAAYQQHLQENDPDELQVIDEVVRLQHLADVAAGAGFEITNFSLEDVWLRRQYAHVVLQRPTGLRPLEESPQLRWARRAIGRLIRPGESFILVDDDQIGPRAFPGRRALPFLERDGEYWGPPADDATAIRELDRLRGLGAKHIVFVAPAFWWLEHYTGLAGRLDQQFRMSFRNELLVAYELRP